MIPPGSTGWMRLSNDPLRPSDLIEPAQRQSSDSAPYESSNLGDYLNEDSSSSPDSSNRPVPAPSIGSDVDGELDFSSPSPSPL